MKGHQKDWNFFKKKQLIFSISLDNLHSLKKNLKTIALPWNLAPNPLDFMNSAALQSTVYMLDMDAPIKLVKLTSVLASAQLRVKMVKGFWRVDFAGDTNTSIDIHADAKDEYERLLIGEDDDDTESEEEESEDEEDI